MEILMSIMNLTKKEEIIDLIDNANVKCNITIANQLSDSMNEINEEFIHNGYKVRVKSFKEKGAAKSRNKLLDIAEDEICIMADDDVCYTQEYTTVIENAYKENPDADMIIFYIENINKDRFANKKIRNGNINFFQTMQVRTSEITFRKENLKKLNVKFDEKFGPNSTWNRGSETTFMADCKRSGAKIISKNIKIGTVSHKTTTWVKKLDDDSYYYSQGAIYAKISPILYRLFIIRYLLVHMKNYSKHFSFLQVRKFLINGAKKYLNNV